MPMYYFNLCDDETIVDTDGTDLIDVEAAHDHAAGVARELTANSTGFLDQNWSGWTMRVQDDSGLELFALAMSDFRTGNSGNGNSGK
jgi:Domain of unknown function (DUF6894)